MATVLTKYEADVKQYRKAVEAATKDTEEFDDATVKAGKDSTKAYDSAGKAATNLSTQTNNLGKVSKSVGEQVRQLGVRLLGAFAIQQVIGGAINTIVDFQKAMSELSAITGATGDDLDFLRQRAIELGSTTTASAEEVVKGFQLIASAKPELLENGVALAFVTEQAIILADAAGIALPEAAIALTDALNQFNAPAEDAGKFINVLAAASQKGSVLIPDLTNALTEFGAVSRSANVSIEQSAALIETLGEKGIEASRSGIQLRNFLTILQSGADATNPAIVGLDQALENLGEENLSVAELTKRFGRENLVSAQILIEQADRVEELTGLVTGTSIALEQAAVNTDNFSAASDKLSNSYDSFILSLDSGEGILSKTITAVTQLADSFFDALTNLNSTEDAAVKAFKQFELGTKGLQNLGLASEDADRALKSLAFLQEDLAGKTIPELQKETEKLTVFIRAGGRTMLDAAGLGGLLEARFKEIKEAGDAVAESQKEQAAATEEASEATAVQTNTLAGLERVLTKLKSDLKEAEIGSADFNRIQKEIASTSLAIASAQGKETEQQKKLSAERSKAADAELKALDESFKLFKKLEKEDDERAAREVKANLDLQDLRATDLQSASEAIIARRDVELTNQKLTEAERILIREQANQEILKLNEEAAEEQEDLDRETLDKDKARQQDRIQAAVQTLNAIADFAGSINEARTEKELTELDTRREQVLSNENLTEEERQQIEEQFESERAEILRKQAVQDKALAVFQATINGAAAVIAQLTVPGAGPALAIAAGVAAALNLAAIVAQPIPQFHTGGIDIGNREEEFHALLKRGESVITDDKTRMYRPELQAIMDGTLDEHIYNHYVLPQVAKIAMENKDNEQANFANNMVSSMKLNASLSEGNMIKIYLEKQYKELKRLNDNMDQPIRKHNPRHGG